MSIPLIRRSQARATFSRGRRLYSCFASETLAAKCCDKPMKKSDVISWLHFLAVCYPKPSPLGGRYREAGDEGHRVKVTLCPFPSSVARRLAPPFLAAARSRSRSDTTLWCHSLRSRRFATQGEGSVIVAFGCNFFCFAQTPNYIKT